MPQVSDGDSNDINGGLHDKQGGTVNMHKGYIGYGVGLVLLLAGAGTLLAAVKPFQYPIDTKITLRYVMEPAPNLMAVSKNFGDTELAKELQKRTGVNCKYIHPQEGKTLEVLDLMAASDNLPDVIETAWTAFSGGPNAAMNKGYIKRLNPVLASDAPNLISWLKKNPDWDKQIKTDEGDYYAFPFVRPDEKLLVTSGPIIRKDWLKELKLKYPETPNEWYTVLKAFKEKKGATAPLSMSLPQLQTDVGSGFDVNGDLQGFYIDGHTVKFSFNTPQYKQFLITMNRWFAAGLLDSGFANLNNHKRDANILKGKSGIVDGSAGSGISVWMKAMKKKQPGFEVVGIKYAVPVKGQRSKFSRRSSGYGGNNGGSAAIGSKCKWVKIAARMLDYNYSPEGSLLLNFGIENVSYRMIDGRPVYTSLVTKDPELPMAKALARYTRSHFNGPFIQDGRYIEQYYNLPQQRESQKHWTDNDYSQYMLPSLTPNDQESMQIAQIMNDVNKYIKDMSIRYIMGVEAFKNYDGYVDQINKMGLQKALKIYQKSYFRYQKRKSISDLEIQQKTQ